MERLEQLKQQYKHNIEEINKIYKWYEDGIPVDANQLLEKPVNDNNKIIKETIEIMARRLLENE